MAEMAVTAQTKLDARKLRADFPIFEQEVRGKPLAYLDSAVSAHKPRQVLDKLRTFYETSYANVHRGVYTLSELATAEYEGAREKVARFINAPAAREVIFTHGATESINLVAYAWGLDNLGPGDVVVVTELEHHSNFVPWQYIAKRTGATFEAIPLDEHGELRLDALEDIARVGNVKVVANNLVSNALGTINPVERLAAWAHEQGAIMVVDAAQAAPHHAIDVQQLGCGRPGGPGLRGSGLGHDDVPSSARAVASFHAIQPSSAHLIRAGYFDTPANATASSSRSSSGCPAPLDCMSLRNPWLTAIASSTLLPMTRSVMTDALAWLIEQPRES